MDRIELFDTPSPDCHSGVTLAEHVANSGNIPCDHCGKPFWPRTGTGGRKQKYCGEACRRAANAERKANAPQRAQCAEAISGAEYPEVPKRNEFALQAPNDSDESWFLDNKEHIVLAEQAAVALYWNERDDLVIRQEKSWCDDQDHIVCIRKDNLMGFIDKLCDIAGIPSFGK